MGPNPAEGCFRGFLHDITELTGQFESALSGHQGAFHFQHLAAHRRIGQAVHHANARFLLRIFPQIARRSEQFVQRFHAHGHGPLTAVQHFHSRLATDCRCRTFQRANARFPRIAFNHGLHGRFVHLQCVLTHPVFPNLFR